MATGMQTGRRTGQSPLRTGVSPGGNAGGGGVGGILQKWTDLDSKKKTLIIVVGVVLIVAAIAFTSYTSSNKFVPLYSTQLTSSDAQTISTELSQMGIPYEMAEGGTGILISPKDKRKALLILASKGLPSRKIMTTNGNTDEGGFAPPTREEKERKYLQQLTGDLTETIRQIDGIADAYIKIVPKPQSAWGAEDKATASASIMLKMVPGAKISKQQIKGIVQLVAYSVDGLMPENVKIVDTTGKVLNNMVGDGADSDIAEGGSGTIQTKEMMETKAYENKLKQNLQASLDKILGGPGRSEVQVSVELDFSQKEVESIKHGGPANVDGKVVVGEQIEKETYTSDPGKAGSGGTEQMANSSGDKSNYIKIKKTTRVKTDQVKTRVVNTAHDIKRISCGVMLNGVTDPKQKASIEAFVKESIGYVPSRGDTVAVNSFPFTNTQLLEEMNNRPAAAAAPPGYESGASSEKMPPWAYAAMAVPVLLVIMLVMLFYIKQKNVQKEKQRLVLTTGPGATVSDISDLLSDKEGKVTPPAATKVNTTDQLEKLAKEKPTKVAELLKSTWLADQ